MKRIFRSMIACVLCMAILASSMLTVFAEPTRKHYTEWDWENENDLQRITDFFNQTDEDGVTNGDKLLEHTRTLPGYKPTWYDPEDLTPIFGAGFVDIMSGRSNVYIHKIEPIFYSYCYLLIEPDYYGVCDFSNTSIRHFVWDYNRGLFSSHITAMNLNGCEKLRHIYLTKAVYCTELHAMGSFDLRSVTAVCCPLKLLEVELQGYDSPIVAKALGAGSLEFPEYNQNVYPEMDYTLKAVPNGIRFYGWYINGERVTINRLYRGEHGHGVNITAVFSGDADGDDTLTMADAITILRNCIGVESGCQVVVGDVDCDGTLGVPDAILLARLLLGVV